MKKNNFLIIAILIAFGMNAQNFQQALQLIEPAKSINKKENAVFVAPKTGFDEKSDRAATDTIPGMYWNFAGGFPADWTRADLSSNQIGGWQHTLLAPQGQFSTNIGVLNSTSNENGYMILDGDFYNPGTPPSEHDMDAYMQTPVLDLSSYQDVKLHFQYAFRYCCDASEIEMNVRVSTDGGTTFTNIDFRDGLEVNRVSVNAVNKNINISNIAGGQSNVVIRFHVKGASHYFWMIDDVAITEAADNDLVLLRRFVDFYYEDGGYYTQLPYSQLGEIDFRGRTYNNGVATQTGAKLNIAVTKDGSEIYNSSSSGASIGRLDTTILSLTNTFNPEGTGEYSISFNLNQDQEDQIPTDNTLPNATFSVGDTICARDDGNTESLVRYSTSNYVGGDVDGSRAVTRFDLPNEGSLKSMSIFIFDDSLTVGTSFKAVVYGLSDLGITLNPLLESDIVDINTSADLNKWYHIPFITDGVNEIIPEDGASYLVGIEVFGVGATSGNRRVSIGAERRTQQPQRTTYVYITGGNPGWGFTENGQPLIRLNILDPTASVNNINPNYFSLGQNIPNPTSNETRIEYFISEFTNVNLSVIDITGKSVYAENLGNKAQGKHQINLDLSDLSNGIYFYTLRTKFGEQTKRMVIAK